MMMVRVGDGMYGDGEGRRCPSLLSPHPFPHSPHPPTYPHPYRSAMVSVVMVRVGDDCMVMVRVGKGLYGDDEGRQ